MRIKNFTTLAKGLFALALLGNATASLSQTLPGTNNYNPSSQDKKRLERFEKQVEELRTRLKVPGMSAAIIKDQKVHLGKRIRVRGPREKNPCNAGHALSPRFDNQDIWSDADYAACRTGETESR